MNKKIKCIVTSMLIVFSTNAQVLATPSDTIKSNLQQSKESLKSVQQDIEKGERKVEGLDHQIESIMMEVKNNKNKIVSTEKSINTTEGDIKKSEEDIKKEEELFKGRMRATYISGIGGYLDIIFQADGVGDLIDKVEAVKSIVKYDKQLIEEFNSKKNALENKKKILQKEKEDLLALKEANDKKLSQLNDTKKEQDKLLAELKDKERSIKGKIGEDQKLLAKAMEEVNNIRQEAPKYDPGKGSANVTNDNIIAYASNFLGTPYVWGGTTPVPGFDCSGFLQYVYAHFGISIGRTTYDQINDGVQVSRDDLQPGDLIFFGTFENPHHVGMYIGNGAYIHAPHTGDVIKISQLNRDDYLTARRVK